MASKPLPRGVAKLLDGFWEWTDDGYLSVDLEYEDGDLVLTIKVGEHVEAGMLVFDIERYVLTPKE
jgi:hypothetical protein